MSGKRNDWDDGRRVADMSGVSRPSLLRPRDAEQAAPARTAAPEERTDRVQETDAYTPQERRWAVLGALKATLLIAGAYGLGLGLVIWLLLRLWT